MAEEPKTDAAAFNQIVSDLAAIAAVNMHKDKNSILGANGVLGADSWRSGRDSFFKDELLKIPALAGLTPEQRDAFGKVITPDVANIDPAQIVAGIRSYLTDGKNESVKNTVLNGAAFVKDLAEMVAIETEIAEFSFFRNNPKGGVIDPKQHPLAYAMMVAYKIPPLDGSNGEEDAIGRAVEAAKLQNPKAGIYAETYFHSRGNLAGAGQAHATSEGNLQIKYQEARSISREAAQNVTWEAMKKDIKPDAAPAEKAAPVKAAISDADLKWAANHLDKIANEKTAETPKPQESAPVVPKEPETIEVLSVRGYADAYQARGIADDFKHDPTEFDKFLTHLHGRDHTRGEVIRFNMPNMHHEHGERNDEHNRKAETCFVSDGKGLFHKVTTFDEHGRPSAMLVKGVTAEQMVYDVMTAKENGLGNKVDATQLLKRDELNALREKLGLSEQPFTLAADESAEQNRSDKTAPRISGSRETAMPLTHGTAADLAAQAYHPIGYAAARLTAPGGGDELAVVAQKATQHLSALKPIGP